MKQHIPVWAAGLGISLVGVSAGCGSSTTDVTPSAQQSPVSGDDDQAQPSSTSTGGSDAGGPAFVGQTSSDASFTNANPSTTDGSGIPTSLTAIIRDFRFYDANDPTTNPDFENPPPAAANGNADDKDIVTDTLGSDGSPVYKNPSGTTLTTHGETAFDQWYRDTAGTNIHVEVPVPMTANADGSFGYDSQTMGVPYNLSGVTGNGFFPIDDGSPYQTSFGNQGAAHNYSFTVAIHTFFTYMGGEYFNFRGDDDVWVYVGGKLVIDLGGIHAAEPGTVMLDTLGLTIGQTYPLDFFSAERHQWGSNIEFTTTIAFKPPPK